MRLEDLKEGARYPGDSGEPADQPPDWLDMAKFRRGQAFFRKHISAIAIALHCSLTVGFSNASLLDPLVFTKNSNTAKKAKKRYLQTFAHLVLWHVGNVWGGDKEPAFKSILAVRQMHKRVGEKINETLPACDGIYVSQYDMALVQTGFCAAVVIRPTSFGINCTKDELEDYIHLWRGLGYLLGIQDRYNVCSDGTHDATYALFVEIENKVLIAALGDPPKNFAPMADAYIQGINLLLGFAAQSKESVLAFSYEIGGLTVPALSVVDRLRVWLMKLTVFLTRCFPAMEWWFNQQALTLYEKCLPLIEDNRRKAFPY